MKMIIDKCIALIIICLLSQCTTAQVNPRRPNIVFILADDLGYGDVGINGQKLIKTPNIDKLAKDGIVFHQFYAGSTVCAPSRSALLTGLHTGHTYIRGNLAVKPEGEQPLADSIVTVTEILRHAGYRTGAFGKWGLGPVWSTGDPLKHGFDNFFGYNSQSLAHRYYPTHLWDNDQRIELEGNRDFLQQKDYAPDIIQQKAIDFIDASESQQPFFLFLPYILPHAELLVPDDSLFQYYKGKFPETLYKGHDYGVNATDDGYTSQAYPHATFAAMVARLDMYVGQIIFKLKEKGLDKNTIVIFSSDNGPHIEGGADPAFFNSAGKYRGTKRDLYEGGIHIPFIVKWTGVIKPGTSTQFVGAFWDLFATLAELTGVKKIPHNDGISIVPSLTGKSAQRKHSYLYWEFHEQGGKQAVRQDNWKAIRLNVDSLPQGLVELYDLSIDPKELNNLATKYPSKVKSLSQLINKAHVTSILFPFKKER